MNELNFDFTQGMEYKRAIYNYNELLKLHSELKEVLNKDSIKSMQNIHNTLYGIECILTDERLKKVTPTNYEYIMQIEHHIEKCKKVRLKYDKILILKRIARVLKYEFNEIANMIMKNEVDNIGYDIL